MSNVPTETEPTPPGDYAAPDPFLSLHKMSTTAGLGSADYVAINGAALATVILGIASAVVLFDNNLLLLIPLAAIVCGVLAFIQITQSNGTQTGKLLVVLGILLALGFGGFVVGKQVLSAAANHADQTQVLDLLGKLNDDVKADKYDDAYLLTDDAFRAKVTQATFVDRFKSMSAIPQLGHVSNLEWNGHMEFDSDPVTGERLATTYVKIGYAKIPDAERSPVVLRKGSAGWIITALPNMFPPDQPAPGGAAAAKSSGPVQPAGPPAPK